MKIAERWLVWAGMVLLGAIALAGLVVAVYAAWLFHDLPDASDLADYRPPTATRVYAGDGTLIGEFSDERRIYVSYDQIPTHRAGRGTATPHRRRPPAPPGRWLSLIHI